MGISQTKRLSALDNTVAANAENVLNIQSEEPCNIHGLIVDIMIGQTGTGLSFGYWSLYLIPRPVATTLALNTTNINGENDSAVTWMIGTWMTDDAGVISHIGGSPRTSRNCPRGGKLVLVISNSALSGSTIRIHGTLSWFETIK